MKRLKERANMCTSVRFSDKKGNMFFGRNLDWNTYEDITIKSAKLSDFDIDSSELAELKIGNVI